MFEGYALPQIHGLHISKSGNQSGQFRMDGLVNCASAQLVIDGSLPFAKTHIEEPPAPDVGNPDSARQHLFEACVQLIRLAYDGTVAPYRFRDAEGMAWRFDKSAAWWLLQSGRWELVPAFGAPDFGVRQTLP